MGPSHGERGMVSIYQPHTAPLRAWDIVNLQLSHLQCVHFFPH